MKTRHYDQKPFVRSFDVGQPRPGSGPFSPLLRADDSIHPVMIKKESPHHAFIAQWVTAFETFHKRKYFFSGRDATVVKEFIDNDFPIEEIIRLATLGWKSSDEYLRTRSSALFSFPEVLNRISVEDARPIQNNHNI